MFEVVFSIQVDEDASRLFFYGLAIFGGVIGAFLPPIGRLSRLPYFGFVILIFGATFALIYSVSQSVNIPLVFWGYISIGVLSGIASAWAARARSADIVGDGRYAFLGFIPLAALYLFFAGGRFLGEGVTKSDSTGNKFALVVVAILGVLGAFGAVDLPSKNRENQFATEVAASVVPARLDSMTLLLRAEAHGSRVKIFHTFEGDAETLNEAAFERLKANVCAETEISQLFSQAGVEREFIYLTKDGEPIGSFVARC